MLSKISGFIPLVTNPGFCSWYSGLLEKGAAPLIRQLRVEKVGSFFVSSFFFFLTIILGLMSCHLQVGALEVVSLGDWIVSSSSFFLFAGQLQLGPGVAHCQFMQGGHRIFFSPGSSCTSLQLQLCLVGSSPSKVGQYRF
jgi:hypothetical protein